MELISKRNRKPTIDMSSMIYGKVPPQAKEVEEAVLGAILIESRAFGIVSEILRSECFYVESHKIIFEVMLSLNQKNQVIELLSVVEELKRTEQLDSVGGPYYVTKLTNSVVSTAALEQHSRIILEKFMMREIIRIGGEMVSMGFEDSSDVFDVLDQTEKDVFAISNSFLKKDFEKLSNVGAKVITRIDQLRNSDEKLSGVPSGFVDIDQIVHGWQNTDLIILAARPSVGKSAFALNLAVNACVKTGVGFFSLEMGAEQLAQRILSAQSEVWMEKISQGKMTDIDYSIIMSKGIKKLESLPIYIDDSSALNIFEFRAKARRMVSRHNVGLIIIDYLQLMSGLREKNGNREQEISTISRNLKALAKDLNIPIIALSQLSRGVEQRGSQEPKLSDLRESGALEQDADIVAFLYRTDDSDQIELKVAKHRNGKLEKVRLKANLSIQKFYDSNDLPSPDGFKPVSSFIDAFQKPF
jgi:replicative DNA helicase